MIFPLKEATQMSREIKYIGYIELDKPIYALLRRERLSPYQGL